MILLASMSEVTPIRGMPRDADGIPSRGNLPGKLFLVIARFPSKTSVTTPSWTCQASCS